MKNDIEEKLRNLLAAELALDEVKVVYLLVESRKLLEHDKALRLALPTLDFYCNWGLHIQLDRAGARAFLGKVNPILTLSVSCEKEEHDVFNSLLTLDSFRLELRSLLIGIGADSSVCDDPTRWADFLHVYSHVVQDSELAFTGTALPSGPLKLAVRKVTIRPVVGDRLADPAMKIYPMTWFIDYVDGRIGRLELSKFGLAGATVEVFVPASGTGSGAP